jgi:hypothetical protein
LLSSESLEVAQWGVTPIGNRTYVLGTLIVPDAHEVIFDSYLVKKNSLAVQRGGQSGADFVDDAIAVVVEVVAGVSWEVATPPTGVEQTFVGLPIAVVIDVVAPLGHGLAGNGVAAGGIQVLADHHAGAHTCALPHTARLAEAKALVGGVVAVVVVAVAGLGSGQDLAFAGSKSATAVAESHAGLAVAKSVAALWPFVATASLAWRAVAEGSVVDAAIAVVVTAVAALVLVGGEGSVALFHPAFAGQNPLCAHSGLAGVTGGAVDALVDGPVAVVVLAVAGFNLGLKCDCGANHCSAIASSGSFDSADALFSSKACLAEVEALVDGPVAVVILSPLGIAVAGNLRDRISGLGVADRVGIPTCTAHQAALTGTDALAAGALVAQARDVVDGAIAVVVLVVAGLGAGSTRTCVAAGVGMTVANGHTLALASADTRLTRIAEALKVLVGAAIAVVVAIVAHLICRGTWIPLADDFAASRDAYALTFSGASSNAHGTPADAGELVGAAITVVVGAITDLVLRQDLSFAGTPGSPRCAGLLTHATRADVGSCQLHLCSRAEFAPDHSRSWCLHRCGRRSRCRRCHSSRARARPEGWSTAPPHEGRIRGLQGESKLLALRGTLRRG